MMEGWFCGLSGQVKHRVLREGVASRHKIQIIKLVFVEANKDNILKYNVILERINSIYGVDFTSFWKLLGGYLDKDQKLHEEAVEAYELLIKGAQ